MRTDLSALAAFSADINRAVSPAADVLRVLNTVPGLVPSLLFDPHLLLPEDNPPSVVLLPSLAVGGRQTPSHPDRGPGRGAHLLRLLEGHRPPPVCLLQHPTSPTDVPVVGMACHASGGQLAMAGVDERVWVWDVDGGFCTLFFRGHHGIVTSVVFIPIQNARL